MQIKYFLLAVSTILVVYVQAQSFIQLNDGVCHVFCKKRCGFDLMDSGNWFKRLKAEYQNDEETYSALIDDMVNYIYNTHEYLQANRIDNVLNDTLKIKGLFMQDCPLIKFDRYTLDISKINAPYVYVLYEKGKKPYLIKDITLSEEEIDAYFKIKPSQNL